MIETLSERERQVAELVVEGLSNKLIADALDISEHTIKYHLRRLSEKYETKSRVVVAVRFALERAKQKAAT